MQQLSPTGVLTKGFEVRTNSDHKQMTYRRRSCHYLMDMCTSTVTVVLSVLTFVLCSASLHHGTGKYNFIASCLFSRVYCTFYASYDSNDASYFSPKIKSNPSANTQLTR